MEWYSDPANRDKRKARMRAYGQATTELGQRHPEERLAAYRQAVADGKEHGSRAQNQANATLRSSYPDEFRRLFEEKLSSESTAPVTDQQL